MGKGGGRWRELSAEVPHAVPWDACGERTGRKGERERGRGEAATEVQHIGLGMALGERTGSWGRGAGPGAKSPESGDVVGRRGRARGEGGVAHVGG